MGDERQQQERQSGSGTPLLEWIASAVGLLLTLGILGSIGWEALTGGSGEPPAVDVAVERIVPTGHGYVVEVRARNRSSATAAAVQIEGTLKQGGREVATSTAIIDYVPGESDRRAGLFFMEDPRGHQLGVRALGYAEP
jgi:uncharacterized protein (TIGR02588 family)